MSIDFKAFIFTVLVAVCLFGIVELCAQYLGGGVLNKGGQSYENTHDCE